MSGSTHEKPSQDGDDGNPENAANRGRADRPDPDPDPSAPKSEQPETDPASPAAGEPPGAQSQQTPSGESATGDPPKSTHIIGDLTDILKDWPFETGQVNVRLFQANDGRPVLQMRIDLGILQMEVNGRPDGKTQDDGCETLLEVWVIRLQQHMQSGRTREDFVIPVEACRRLREEAIQFHHRYVSLFALDEYGGVIRDAEHNLRIMDFVSEFGETEFDRAVMEQLRPNTIMMRTRAEASKAVTDGQPKLGIAALDRGLEEIREAMLDEDPTEEEIEEYDQSQEVQLLRAMREALVPRLPVSQRSELQDRLRAAVAAENYELAAILRDELRMLKD